MIGLATGAHLQSPSGVYFVLGIFCVLIILAILTKSK